MRRARSSRVGVTLGVAVAAILTLGVTAPAHAEQVVTSDGLAFRVVVAGASGQGDADADADGDGVSDASDVCAGTTFTAGPADLKLEGDSAKAKAKPNAKPNAEAEPDDHPAKPKRDHNRGELKPNHSWSTSEAGFVDATGAVRYTLDETGGCSAEQIIAAAGLGKGHMKHGISVGAMRKWIASLEK
ncbi:hypothetical protein J2X63_000760 [Agromyces sp. 3263]|uniref:hypothetical protein n=1 Tax=Agromyces sp. 3263 TaxID=2817750 RepID=UPI00286102EA|nr:hypothetical protein [Agromyces sp. 3263]MDR6905074.1 hypothetical protein [Agromyces sp. 3263]